MGQRDRRASPQIWPAYAVYGLPNLRSGQGEAPERLLAAYLVVCAFTNIYWAASNFFATSSQPLEWNEALVLSLKSFHGRGFFPSQIGLGDPLAIVAAAEAVIGPFIERKHGRTRTNAVERPHPSNALELGTDGRR